MRQDRSNLAHMTEEDRGHNPPGRPDGWQRHLVWIAGVWVLPIVWILRWAFPPSALTTGAILVASALLAPAPGLLFYRRRHRRALADATNAREEAEELKLQLQNVRFRTV